MEIEEKDNTSLRTNPYFEGQKRKVERKRDLMLAIRKFFNIKINPNDPYTIQRHGRGSDIDYYIASLYLQENIRFTDVTVGTRNCKESICL